MDLAKEKQALRKETVEKRESISKEEFESKSSAIKKRIFTLPEWKQASIIYTYASMRNEPDTIEVIEKALQEGKKVCVPKIFGKEMRFIPIDSTDRLKKGTWGIPEPDDTGVYEDRPGLMIVPGILFGRDFNRIGYGAGYYDRYFDGRREDDGWFLVAVAYDFQIRPEIPREEFDIYMDALITNKETLRRK